MKRVSVGSAPETTSAVSVPPSRSALSTSLTVPFQNGLPELPCSVAETPLPPPSTGGSFVAVIVTVVEPRAWSAPPVPCEPAFPSSKVQSRVTFAGGVSLEFA